MDQRIQKLIYPAIVLVVLLLSAFTIIQATRFIAREINDIFVIDQSKIDANLTKVNLEKYNDAAEKLNLKLPTPPSSDASSPSSSPASPQPSSPRP